MVRQPSTCVDGVQALVLDAVGSGLVEGASRGHVLFDFRFGEISHQDAAFAHIGTALAGFAVDDGDACHDAVDAPTEACQHLPGLSGVGGFAQRPALQDYEGVGSYDEAVGMPLDHRLGFGEG